MFRLLQKIFRWLLNLVFPIRCLGCGKFDIWICDECLARVKLAQVECPGCRRSMPTNQACIDCLSQISLDRLIVWADYQNPLIQKAIHALKYGFVAGLSTLLGRALAQQIMVYASPLPGSIVLVPVPLHWQRRNERGFNQATLLARAGAKVLNVPCWPHAIRRTKYTAPQATLSRQDRLSNLTGLFALDRGLDFSGKIVIIIDDVATTGATLQECAKVLKSAGAAEVWGAVLARSHN
ncbi:MAG: ComF family protein [Patescibacteria group bacterium]|jgi:ComF family protein